MPSYQRIGQELRRQGPEQGCSLTPGCLPVHLGMGGPGTSGFIVEMKQKLPEGELG